MASRFLLLFFLATLLSSISAHSLDAPSDDALLFTTRQFSRVECSGPPAVCGPKPVTTLVKCMCWAFLFGPTPVQPILQKLLLLRGCRSTYGKNIRSFKKNCVALNLIGTKKKPRKFKVKAYFDLIDLTTDTCICNQGV